ncbi:N-succinylarginine dihydrolase [Chitiniphilus shinanonensis]|uniref:N-succinylarginine dihydrolase n=1 Tax=Chitiniphilus shinanonensis TaxID=553088 RepID=A0ABQ6BT77_9NEIS|nr:N-succinylarginine dihydrolase [Chitiniphilus shinanonensis]GLS03093.1 N-succinylarginine dihydrolase [Chitiniphilus shinanonensis]
MSAFEANFDGLVGPTHHYGGHSFGNVASTGSAGQVADPRAAARQGLAKMKALADLGYRQAVLPPQERPAVWTLRQLGFGGSDPEVLAAAAREPQLLAAVSSAAAMWTANAATVSPSADTRDGRVHFSVANLQNKFHRALEAEQTARTLRAIFKDEARFAVHDALPMHPAFGDEGAANHTRFCKAYDAPGVECFVYGRRHWGGGTGPSRFPARQTLEASEAVARRHGLNPADVVFAQQRPEVIDAGVFHNDVIAVGNLDVLFCHAHAFVDQQALYRALDQRLGGGLRVVEVPAEQVGVEDAVRSYLFNSQLLDRGGGRMRLVVPEECRANPAVWQYLTQLIESGGPIDDLLVLDLKQSMRNGGGPACLRLRVALTAGEGAAVNPRIWLSEERYAELDAWIGRHYRDHLSEADLADPQLLVEVRTALDELTRMLGLGSIYPFQYGGTGL